MPGPRIENVVGEQGNVLNPLEIMNLTKEEYERRCRVIEHHETAARLGIDDDALREVKAKLAAVWKDGGGIEGALHRLKFANRFITRKTLNEKLKNAGPETPGFSES